MENAGFNAFDITVVGILLISGFLALRRGLIGEIMALGTWLIATVFTFSFFPLVRPLAEPHIQNVMLADAATGLGLFCLAIVILVPLGDFINDFIKGPTLGSIDRSLGFVFGLIRGFVIVCLLFMIVIYIWPAESEDDDAKQPEWLSSAKTTATLTYGVELLKSLVPEDSEEQIARKLEESREKAKEAKDNADLLEDLSIPMPSFPDSADETPAFYEDNARDTMNDFFDENGTK